MHEIQPDGRDILIRPMTSADEAAVLDFARALPPHDLLFLPRDITKEKVLRAWISEIEAGEIKSLLAESNGELLGCAALVHDPLSWSPHVCELRLVVSPATRGLGVGRALLHEVFDMALALDAKKIIAQMTSDQKDAISLFEGLGFKAEALLRDHVRDASGETHDIVVLSHDVQRFAAQLNAFGTSARQ